jgi:hypothetical protein
MSLTFSHQEAPRRPHEGNPEDVPPPGTCPVGRAEQAQNFGREADRRREYGGQEADRWREEGEQKAGWLRAAERPWRPAAERAWNVGREADQRLEEDGQEANRRREQKAGWLRAVGGARREECGGRPAG